MERYYGFDLGDAESAVARLRRAEAMQDPEVLPVCDAPSFITAFARRSEGDLLIGEAACYASDVLERKIRFKSRFLTDPESAKDVRTFAAGVLSWLIREGSLVQGEDSCFYVGCPAGWNKADRERYRRIFEDVGYPPVRIVSESRAALISACRSKHLQVAYDILSKPVLVVDIGSSTTDFAFIESGREVELQTAGEVMLGGGIMDRMLLEESVKASPERAAIEQIFAENEAWRNYCEFAARRLKEKYYADEDYWAGRSCSRSIGILYKGEHHLTIRMDAAMADRILHAPAPGLDGASFKEAFCRSLSEIRSRIKDTGPELIFLTGGVSKLPAIGKWCQEAFPQAVVITTPQPEFSVARGLAHCGRIDEDIRAFRKEVDDLIETSTVESIVAGHMGDLYRRIADALVDPIMEQPVMNVFDRWRSGQISRLSEIDEELAEEIEHFLRGEDAQKILVETISSWLSPVAYELEEYTMPICVRHNVPYRALNLNSYLSLTDIDIRIDTKDMFALDQITWMINAIISVLVGLMCGGSGVALIAGGLEGIIVGAILSLSVLLIGQEHIENRMMDINLPRPLRKLVTRSSFENRMKKLSPEVKASFLESLEKEKNTEITARLTEEISGQIEQCLTKMAEIVEIPLG
ncbi:MAG: Hsp70 family protein [Lachnospiraceae bacterium]|nr:Hsp70 family protein [Lachnospiraceae bacterium]